MGQSGGAMARRVVGMAALALAVWSCGDPATTVELPAPSAHRQIASAGQEPSRASGDYACFLNIYDRQAGTFRYYHLPLTVPHGLARAGGKVKYRYRGYERGTEYAILANCYIPDSPNAAAWLTRQFRGGPVADEDVALLACPEGTVCLDELEVKACQWRGTWPNCKPPLSSDIPPCYDGGGCGGGDPIPTGGTGPVCEDCFPDEEPPCRTGDPVLDDPAVQDGFSDLWEASNPDASDPNARQERGGWIVREPTGALKVVAFSDVTYGGCTIYANDGYSPNPPGNAVGWVHTHPFGFDEIAYACGFVDWGGTGLRIIPKYRGQVSSGDALVGDRINQRLQAVGKPTVDGYMIDKGGIKRFTPVAASATVGVAVLRGVHARCGY